MIQLNIIVDVFKHTNEYDVDCLLFGEETIFLYLFNFLFNAPRNIKRFQDDCLKILGQVYFTFIYSLSFFYFICLVDIFVRVKSLQFIMTLSVSHKIISF